MASQRLGGTKGTPSPRRAAFDLLRDVGFPTGEMVTNTGHRVPFLTVMVACAEIESDLYIDAQGPPNTNGTVDRGWLQINSVHGYDEDRLLSDARYTAVAGLHILLRQGMNAWASYSKKPYVNRMPPCYGGPVIEQGQTNERVKSVQEFLNNDLDYAGTTSALTTDGAFGPRTAVALATWKKRYHDDGHGRIDGLVWQRMQNRGLR